MSSKQHLDLLMQAACRKHADELRVRSGQPPMLYCDSQFKKVTPKPITPKQIAMLMKHLAPDEVRRMIEANGQAKFYVDFNATRFFVLAARSEQALDIRIRRCH